MCISCIERSASLDIKMKKLFLLSIVALLLGFSHKAEAFWAGPYCPVGGCTPTQQLFVASTDEDYGMCYPFNNEGSFKEFFYFDKYGTRINAAYGDSVTRGHHFECVRPIDGTASTTQWYVYHGEVNGWCSTNYNASLSQCQANDFITYLRSYTRDFISGEVAIDTTLNSNILAAAIMSPMLNMVMGSGLGILKSLLPFILGTIIILSIAFFIYRGMRFMRH